MEEKKNINVNKSIDYLKFAMEEVEETNIFDSDIAEIRRAQLRAAIYPVMKTFLTTTLNNDEEVKRLLLEAIALEDRLSKQHTDHIKNGN